jgi:DNA polymerase-3 subunit gamma/tau
MAYQVLARKYRPQRFADVAGQDHVTRTLLNALAQNRIAHGYIFSGHRGIGKTTIARILAMALNCRTQVGSAERPTPEPCGVCDSCTEIRQGNAVDVIEIDAATNRGIDEIRELREGARYSPARDRYKIYILDEAHQITEAAFNALLKTLEEPPAHVIFMMATTEPENIPQTIRSRCQHFSFHAVKFDDILTQLHSIALKEQIEAEQDALALLAEAGDGSMRDALSIMDQAIASAPIQNGRPVLASAEIRELMGSVPNAAFERLLEAVAAGQSAALMEQSNVLVNAGHSPHSLARQMVRYLRNALMARLGGEQTELLQTSADERARSARTALLFTEEDLTRNLQIMLRTFDDLNYRQEQRFHLELGLLKLIHAQRLLPMEELLSGLTGSSASSRAAAPAPRASASVPAAARPAAPKPTPSNSAALSSISSSISPFAVGTGSPRASSSNLKPAGVETGGIDAGRAEAPAATLAVADAPPIVSSSLNGTTHQPASLESLQASAEIAAPGDAHSASAAEPSAPPSPAAVPEIESLRTAIVAALAAQEHSVVAQRLSTAAWTIDGANLRIEVPGIGKKTLAVYMTEPVQKILRQELQRLGGPARFLVVPGEAGSGAAAAQDAASFTGGAQPASGSVQEAALNNPLARGKSSTPRCAACSTSARNNRNSIDARRGVAAMINPLKLTEMLSQAGQMQEEMQRKLNQTVVEASSGGGAVTATVNGKKELLKLRIDPSAVVSLSGGSADVEMLENLIVGAINEAGRKAEEAVRSSVTGMLGGLKIPGLNA